MISFCLNFVNFVVVYFLGHHQSLIKHIQFLHNFKTDLYEKMRFIVNFLKNKKYVVIAQLNEIFLFRSGKWQRRLHIEGLSESKLNQKSPYSAYLTANELITAFDVFRKGVLQRIKLIG